MQSSLNEIVEKANSGDQKLLELVIDSIKDMVYNLSVKILLYPEDAEDATQDILIKVITHLSTFNQRSSFKTWAYRIAINYLITFKGKRTNNFRVSFNDYEKQIDTGQSNQVAYTTNTGEITLLEEEVKISCTQGLLLCLNAVDRAVYILAKLLDFNSVEGAQLLDISATNFRKKLSRSRDKIRNFLTSKCGIANPNNPCRCSKKIDFLINKNIIDLKLLRFAKHSENSIHLINQIDTLEKSTLIYRSNPTFNTPQALSDQIKKRLFDSI